MLSSTLALSLLVASTSAAAATPTPSTPWLKGLVEKARVLAEEDVKPDTPAEQKWKARIKTIVDDILDWDELAKRSLGRHYKTLDETQRAEFSKLLREMIEASYTSKLRMHTHADPNKKAEAKKKKVSIEWLEEKTRGARSQAIAEVKNGRSKTELKFKMRWVGDGWKVYDLYIDDAGTVTTYRSQFGKIIAERGFDALLERMKEKKDEIEQGLADLAPSN